jgi:phosphate transport system permease protein
MSALDESALGESMLFDPAAPLTASGNLRRRAVLSRFVDLMATAAAAVAIAMLTWVVWTVIKRGAPALSFAFFTQNPQGLVAGGIVNSILGTLVIVLFGAAIAVPLGILCGLYLTEFAGPNSRAGRILKVSLEMMQGLPTIVVGLFVFGLLVLPLHKETGFAGAVALAIIMLPLIARSSQEMLLLVPGTLREAADALGVSRWRGVKGIILPAARAGIVTGAILAIARAAGETAPLLICNAIFNTQTTELNPFGHGVPSIPMYIYTISDLAVPDAYTRAWGAAFALMAFVLLANIGSRFLLARSRRKTGQ